MDQEAETPPPAQNRPGGGQGATGRQFSDDLDVLDIIREYSPYPTWRTTSNPRSKYTTRCPLYAVRRD